MARGVKNVEEYKSDLIRHLKPVSEGSGLPESYSDGSNSEHPQEMWILPAAVCQELIVRIYSFESWLGYSSQVMGPRASLRPIPGHSFFIWKMGRMTHLSPLWTLVRIKLDNTC